MDLQGYAERGRVGETGCFELRGNPKLNVGCLLYQTFPLDGSHGFRARH